MAPERTEIRAVLSRCAAATGRLGEVFGRLAPAGSVLALEGELGSGKTCFVRGLARGLGAPPGVASPSYTLTQEHTGGRLTLYHFDAWMEGREKALFADGGDEWLRAGGVAAVEWADRVAEWLPEPRLSVVLEHLGPDRRAVRLRVVGGPSHPAVRAAEAVLAGLIGSLTLPPGVSEGVRPGKPGRR